MATKHLGKPASDPNDQVRLSDINQPGWQNGMNWGRIDSTLYQTTGKGISIANGLSTITPTANTSYAQPFFCTRKQTFTHIGLRVTLALLSGSCKMAMYNDLGSVGQPGTLLLDCGSISLGIAGVKEASINLTLTSGLYWLVYSMNAAGAAISSEGNNGLSQALDANFNVITSLSRSAAYSAGFGNESANTWTAVSGQAAALMWLRN